jgi:hypothetical protein
VKQKGNKNHTNAIQKAGPKLGQSITQREELCVRILDEIAKAAGVSSDVAFRLATQMAEALVLPKPKDEAQVLVDSIAALAEYAPRNILEASLAVQLTATHEAALLFLKRATLENQPSEFVDRIVVRASRLMRLYLEQIEAMQKLKGKATEQKVTVEHVHVHEGGQAIVGAVSTNRGRELNAISKPTPHEKRRGWLKNGNRPGDFSKAPRCGAKTRRGVPCKCPAMKNGRCKLHGGRSTGPKTAEGRERICRAATRHGYYSGRAKAERAHYREILREGREMLSNLSSNGPGYMTSGHMITETRSSSTSCLAKLRLSDDLRQILNFRIARNQQVVSSLPVIRMGRKG